MWAPLRDWRRLVRPALLIDECFGIEPGTVRRFAGDVAIEPGHDVDELHAALASTLELRKSLRLANLVRVCRPKLLAKVFRPAVVDNDQRARARFFLFFFCTLYLFSVLWGRFGNVSFRLPVLLHASGRIVGFVLALPPVMRFQPSVHLVEQAAL
jgi:hypothetical protein